jgi:tetratricopeptide (TPR) repeat protein
MLGSRDWLGYINVSICHHELGRTDESKDFLKSGPKPLKESPVCFYNLACYEAQLGNFEKTKESLNLSFEMDEKFRETAKTDPDLADYWVYLHDQSHENTK